MTGAGMLKIRETADESGGSLLAGAVLTAARKIADSTLGTRTNYCEFTDRGARSIDRGDVLR